MKKLLLLICCVVLLLPALSVAQNGTALDAGVKVPFTFDAYGDIRFMETSNTKDSDPVRRKLLVDKITQDKPAFLLISGDLVANGSNAQQWAIFDSETKPLRDAGVKIYPALGNHDLRGDLPQALSNYFQRFPYLEQGRYYSVRAANVLVLTLDSSLDQPGSEQNQWLNKQLDSIPAGVEFVVIDLHHPPYTRSHGSPTGGGHSAREEEQALAKNLEARSPKSKAQFIVIAGHVHNYERYEHNGVMYIVTGGGGATPYTFQRQSSDFYKDEGPSYHYCHFAVSAGTLSMKMVKLEMENGKPEWKVRDTFELQAK